MAALVPSLVALRAEFDRVFPDRNRGSDGWIGDPAHQARPSDHNPDHRGLVHAIDVTTDLGEGARMQDAVDHLAARKDRRLTYIIFNRRIWSASHDWKPRPYTGDDPHTGHAHISADNIPAYEQNTGSYHLEDLVALTEAQTRQIIKEELDSYSKRDPLATLLARSTEQRTRMAVLMAADPVDEKALGAELMAAVKAGLPSGVTVTDEQLQAAVLGALRELARPAVSSPVG